MRYKEYNPNRVLEKAIPLFWSKGFNGVPVSELVTTTGVNRFSLYEEFGNKEGILYSSLELYRDRYCNDKLDILRKGVFVEDTLKTFYLSFLKGGPGIDGCYIIHIGTELADTDPRVKKCLDDYLRDIYNLIFDLLNRNGIDEQQAAFQARHLLGFYCTVMSFCLIHSAQQREEYISNGLNVILSGYAKSA